MGYKPKYAASQRKKQDIIRSKPEPERKLQPPKKQPGKASRAAGIVLTVLIVPASIFCTGKLLTEMVRNVGRPKETAVAKTQDREVLSDFDAFVAEKMESAVKTASRPAAVDIPEPTVEEPEPPREHYTIPADALVAPEPNQALFGSVNNPADMEPVFQQAKWLLDGQTTYFQLDQKIYEGSTIRYYLDETILAVTWQEVHDDSVYTFSEVKVADASQFRRHLAGGEYGSGMQLLATEMAATVNAVVASSGDFYRFRDFGAVVYQGEARRVEGTYAETCYIDYDGNMHFTRGGEVLTTKAAQEFVDANNINFSLAFGPILVDNYEIQEHTWYGVGEINENYARTALCQMDSLHYLLAVANVTGEHQSVPTVKTFAKNIAATGCRMAYCLDGGQTGVIVMNDEMINRPATGKPRLITDIIYFATAVPEGETKNG